MVVLAMLAQVIRDVVDPLRQNRDLHFRRARVAIVALVLLQDLFFFYLFQLLPHLAYKFQTFLRADYTIYAIPRTTPHTTEQRLGG